MRIVTGFAAISVAVLGAASAHAAVVVFQDDFSDDNANTSSTYSTGTAANFPVIQGANVGGNWLMRTKVSSGNTPTPSLQWGTQVRNDDPVTAGNAYLSLNRNATSSFTTSGGAAFGYAHAQLSSADMAATAGKKVQTSMRFYIGTASLTDATVAPELRIVAQPSNTVGNYANNGDTSAAAFTGMAWGLRILRPINSSITQNTVGLQSGGTLVTGDTTAVPIFKYDEWNTLTVTADYGAATPYFSFVLTNSLGTVSSTNYKFNTANATLGTTSLYTNAGTISAKIDDFQVSILPEPTALAGLAMAAGILRRRRR